MFLVNSPVVRGDNLRFREEGVREVMGKGIVDGTLARSSEGESGRWE